MKTIVFILLLFTASFASAHPMGNFSINHYSAISVAEKGIQLEYIIDLAEIPTFQEMEGLDLNHDRQVSDAESALFSKQKAQEFVRNISLRVNERPLALETVQSSLNVVPGAGGLPTLVLRIHYFARWKTEPQSIQNAIHFRDDNYPERIGWKEIVIRNSNSIAISQKNPTFEDRSKELTEYPQDATMSPPQETEATFHFALPMSLAAKHPMELQSKNHAVSTKQVSKGIAPVQKDTPAVKTIAKAILPDKSRVSSQNANTSPPNKREDSFTRLITAQNLTGDVIAFSLLVAFALGAMHALSPGHGKAIVAGYLVGSRGTAWHALFLGAVVTLTHTIGVFILGLLTLFGSRYILPENLYPWLGFISGISIVIIGLSLFRKRFKAMQERHPQDKAHAPQENHSHDHPHEHHHDHEHGHDHSHLPVDSKTGAISAKSLLTVGISGGALPCPSALVVLLSAISLHRIGFGLLLIVAFSLGLAVVLTSVGVLFVYASHWTRKLRFGGTLLYRMPLISSLIISVLGFAIAIQSLLRV